MTKRPMTRLEPNLTVDCIAHIVKACTELSSVVQLRRSCWNIKEVVDRDRFQKRRLRLVEVVSELSSLDEALVLFDGGRDASLMRQILKLAYVWGGERSVTDTDLYYLMGLLDMRCFNEAMADACDPLVVCDSTKFRKRAQAYYDGRLLRVGPDATSADIARGSVAGKCRCGRFDDVTQEDLERHFQSHAGHFTFFYFGGHVRIPEDVRAAFVRAAVESPGVQNSLDGLISLGENTIGNIGQREVSSLPLNRCSNA